MPDHGARSHKEEPNDTQPCSEISKRLPKKFISKGRHARTIGTHPWPRVESEICSLMVASFKPVHYPTSSKEAEWAFRVAAARAVFDARVASPNKGCLAPK